MNYMFSATFRKVVSKTPMLSNVELRNCSEIKSEILLSFYSLFHLFQKYKDQLSHITFSLEVGRNRLNGFKVTKSVEECNKQLSILKLIIFDFEKQKSAIYDVKSFIEKSGTSVSEGCLLSKIEMSERNIDDVMKLALEKECNLGRKVNSLLLTKRIEDVR